MLSAELTRALPRAMIVFRLCSSPPNVTRLHCFTAWAQRLGRKRRPGVRQLGPQRARALVRWPMRAWRGAALEAALPAHGAFDLAASGPTHRAQPGAILIVLLYFLPWRWRRKPGRRQSVPATPRQNGASIGHRRAPLSPSLSPVLTLWHTSLSLHTSIVSLVAWIKPIHIRLRYVTGPVRYHDNFW